MTRPELAVGAIVVAEGALLLVRRAHEPGRGRWSVPGGRVERGETVVDALLREVHEETGITIEVGELAGWVERIGDDHHFVILDFFGRPVGDAAALRAGDDVDAAEWVPLDQVRKRNLVADLEQFLHTAGVLAD